MKSKRPLAVVASIAVLILTGCAGVGGSAVEPSSGPSATGLPNPGSPVSFIVPNAAGGPNDTLARLIAPLMEEALGSQVQVINVDGAGSQLGITQLAAAKPDGHTIGITNLPSTIGLYTIPERQATFDVDSFTPLAQLTNSYLSIAVNSSSPYKTLDDLIKAAKAKPGQITFGTGGALSNDHLAAIDFERKTGTDFNIVHFAGGAAKYTALLAKDIDVITGSGDGLVTQANAGTYRVLTVLGPDKLEALPDVPVVDSLGYKILQPNAFIVSAPAGLSAELSSLYEKAISGALKDPGVVKKMAALGYVPIFLNGTQVEDLWTELNKSMKPLFLEAAKG
jgi:tripartite-type tricarboxylate transporter receptor subunit TctC